MVAEVGKAMGMPMSGSLSIIMVLISVALMFVATRSESRTSSRQTARLEERSAARRRKLSAPAKRPLSRVDALQRLRTDRADIQRSVGRDFGAPELGERIWPPIQ